MDLANEADQNCDRATNVSGRFHFVKKKFTSVPKIEIDWLTTRITLPLFTQFLESWVLKKFVNNNVFSARRIAIANFSLRLSGNGHNRVCRLAEEPHQSFEVLRSRCQEELLPHELQSPQAQATQTNLMLEFREQDFYLFSLPLGLAELRRLGQLASTLSGQLIPGSIKGRPVSL